MKQWTLLLLGQSVFTCCEMVTMEATCHNIQGHQVTYAQSQHTVWLRVSGRHIASHLSTKHQQTMSGVYAGDSSLIVCVLLAWHSARSFTISMLYKVSSILWLLRADSRFDVWVLQPQFEK